jgi:hypothetical protein
MSILIAAALEESLSYQIVFHTAHQQSNFQLNLEKLFSSPVENLSYHINATSFSPELKPGCDSPGFKLKFGLC